LPVNAPAKAFDVNVDVDGLYVNPEPEYTGMDAPEVDVEKSKGLLLFDVSDVINTFDVVVAVVDVVAFPVRDPIKLDAVKVDVDGTYVNGVVTLSINIVFVVVLVVLLYGIKQTVAAVLSDVNAMVVAREAVVALVAFPENTDAVNVDVDGTYVSGSGLMSKNNAFVVALVVLLNGM
jgi:hypothetical protein